ncbi:MAG: hypothetical protein N2044_10750, partial [Cyclobacteriaceae bacterium]|nr:hypothetical protein [Cyclobacteriaceae bacterium]
MVRRLLSVVIFLTVCRTFGQPPTSIVVEVNKTFSLTGEKSLCFGPSCTGCFTGGYSRLDYGFAINNPPKSYVWSNLTVGATLTHSYSTVNIAGYTNITYESRTEEVTYIDPGCNST